jgi:DNA-binding transcriptional LysR family regulator
MQAMRAPAPNPAALVASFADSHPGVDVLVRHGGGSAEMAEQVADGRLDLGFVSLQGAAPGVALTEVARLPMNLVCATAHPLAGRTSVTLQEIAGERFADLPPLWGTRIVNDRVFAAAGIHRAVRYEVNDTGSLLEFARHNLAVTILPPSIVGYTPDLSSITIEGHPPFIVSLALPSERRVSAAAQALHDHIVAASPGPSRQ